MNRSALGREGEEIAAQSLTEEGLRVVARNFRAGRGEIDIVAVDGDTLVFVEVKSWSVFGFADLEFSLNAAKIRRIVETAKIFLARNREYNSMAVRFDLVFVEGGRFARHLASAFTERV